MQIWEALNSKQRPAAFTRLPSCAPEPWLQPPDLKMFPDAADTDHSSTSMGLLPDNVSESAGSWSHPSRIERSLTGLSGDSEVQLSEMGCSPRQLEGNLSPTEQQQLQEVLNCSDGRAYTGLQLLPDYPRLGSEHLQQPQLQLISAQTAPARSTEQQSKQDECTAAGLPPGTGHFQWQLQQLQGPDVIACSSPLRLRQRSRHSDCGSADSRQSDVEGGSPVSCGAAASVREGRSAGDMGRGHSQQDDWVWWEWRPDDLGFMAAFVQVSCLVWHSRWVVMPAVLSRSMHVL